MKLVSFWREERIRLGFLRGNEILDPGLADSFLEPGEDQFFTTLSRLSAAAN